MTGLRGFLRVFLVLLFRALTRYQVRGLENVPKDGSLLVVSNHLSLADPPLLGASLERRAVFMAKQELFRFPVIRHILGKLGAFPVHRGRLDMRAMRRVYQLLGNGTALVMFPEGMRSRSSGLRSAFTGAAQIAMRANVPVLPVAISGTEALERPCGFFRRPRVTVNIGRPFQLPQASGRASRQELGLQTDRIMSSIAELLPPSYRGDYGSKN